MTAAQDKTAAKTLQEPLPPLCVAGCAWFVQSNKGEPGIGLCTWDPQPVKKFVGGHCSHFETQGEYKRRLQAQLVGDR